MLHMTFMFCTKQNVNLFYQAYSKPQSFSCAFSKHVSVWYDSELPWFRTRESDSCKVILKIIQEKLSLISYLNNVRGGEPFNWVSPVSLINKGWIRVLEPDYISNRRYIANSSHAIFSQAKQRSYSSNIFNSFIRKGNK